MNKYVSGAIASISVTAIYLILTFTIFPITDGWSYFPLGDESKLIYKDYFFPAPPFTYFQAQLASHAGLGVLGYRLTTLWVPALFGWVLFQIFSKYAKSSIALVMTIFSSTLISVMRIESIGGWNYQSQMIVLAGIWFTFRGWEENQASSQRIDSQKSSIIKPLCIQLSGSILLTTALLTKQTVIVNIVTSLIVSIVYFLIFRIRIKNFILYCLGSLAFCVAAVIPVLSYFASRNALSEMFRDIFSGGGKNNSGVAQLSLSILQGFQNQIVDPRNQIFLIIVIALISLYKSTGKFFSQQKYYWVVFCTIGAINLAIFMPKNDVFSVWGTFVIWTISLLLLSKFLPRLKTIFQISICIGPVFIDLLFNRLGLTTFLIDAYPNIQQFWIFIGIFGLGVYFWKTGKQTYTLFGEKKQFRNYTPKNSKWLLIAMMAGTSMGAVLIGVISSGGTFFASWFIPFSGIIILLITHQIFSTGISSQQASVTVISIILIWSLALLALIIKQPYSWWIYKESEISSSRVLSNFPHASGLFLSEVSFNFYTEMVNSINAAAIDNTERTGKAISQQVIFQYPYDNAIYTLTNLKPYSSGRCPTLWFDICPDTLVAQDLTAFKKNSPNVVVWQTPSTRAFQVHEEAFVRKESSLRKWEIYKNRMVAEGRWKLIGIVASDNTFETKPLEIYSVQ